MSFVPVLQYGLGLGVFGFIFWLMDNIMEDIIGAGVHETGAVYSLLMYIWMGCLVIYVVFGGWWVIRKYNEIEYQGGFR